MTALEAEAQGRGNRDGDRAAPGGATLSVELRVPPPELQSRVELPAGFEIVEVGLDVLLVEIATNIVHDVLLDIVR